MQTSRSPRAAAPLARLLTALLATFGLIAGVSVAVAPAAQAATADVIGQVLDSAGDPYSGGRVLLYRWHQDGYWNQMASQDLPVTGTYRFADQGAGTYTIEVKARSGDDDHFDQYLGNVRRRTHAKSFDHTGEGPTIVNLKLLRAGAVSGKITFPDGAPARTWVNMYRWDDVRQLWRYEKDVRAEADGTYTVRRLEPGKYIAAFDDRDEYVGGYYGGAFDEKRAKTFDVAPGQHITAIDMRLRLGGTIKGEVRLSDGRPAEAGEVVLWQVYEDTWGVVEIYDEDYGYLHDGRFEFDGLRPGRYAIGFEVVPGHPDQFVGGVGGVGGATLFTVDVEKTTTVPRYQLRKKLRTDASTTLLSLSHDTRAYGGATTANVTVKGSLKAPNGTVELLSGDKRVSSGKVTNGRATVTLPRDLEAGMHKLRARFLDSDDHTGSVSSVEPLWIRKATAKVGVKLPKKKVPANKRAKVRVTASTPGVAVSGKVLVKKGKKTLRSKVLNKKGKATLKLPKLKRGKHKLRVVLRANRNFESATSKNVTLTVKKAKAKKGKQAKAKTAKKKR